MIRWALSLAPLQIWIYTKIPLYSFLNRGIELLKSQDTLLTTYSQRKSDARYPDELKTQEL